MRTVDAADVPQIIEHLLVTPPLADMSKTQLILEFKSEKSL